MSYDPTAEDMLQREAEARKAEAKRLRDEWFERMKSDQFNHDCRKKWGAA